jgi:hypothetical protein
VRHGPTHEHPAQKPFTSQRISEIFASISTGATQQFLSSWIEKILEDLFLWYDITSISSYSECNEYIAGDTIGTGNVFLN